MNDILPFVVIGITTGSVYGLTATGLVLTYRTSGILNFAHGALAIVAVDAFIFFAINRGYSWEVASVICVFVVGALLGLGFERLGRVLTGSAPAMRVVATIGVLIAIQAGSALLTPHLAGSTPHLYVPPMPAEAVKIGGVYVGKDQMIIVGASLLAAIALYLFLRLTRIGTAMRAVVDNSELLDVTGTSPNAVRRLAWIIGCTFAALSGVLLALSPSFGPRAGTVSALVIPAFGAAALGWFTSIPFAYLGGLAIGVAQSLLTRYLSVSWLADLPVVLPFVVLFVVLIVTPKGRLAEQWATARLAPRQPWAVPRAVRAASLVALLAVLSVLPPLTGFDVNFYTTTLIFVILFLSLGLLVKTSGQLSLCQLGFAAVGAAAFGHLASDHGFPVLFALLGAGLIAGAVGLVAAIPAIRVSGVFLALATLGFGFILQGLFYRTDLMFGGLTPIVAPRPSFAESDEGFYYFVLACVVATMVLIGVLNRSRLGRLLRGMADSPLALQTQGTTVNLPRLMVFGISAFLAGVAGALYASMVHFSTATVFPATESLTLVAVLFVLRIGDPWYAIAAAVAYYLVPAKWLPFDAPGLWTAVVFGVLAVVAVVTASESSSFAGAAGRRLGALRQRVAHTGADQVPLPVPSVASAASGLSIGPPVPLAQGGVGSRSRPGIEVADLTVRFGGIVAVDHLTIAAPTGRVTGLIGPNGSGKSTTFNACSGLLHPAGGTVKLHGRDVSRLAAAARARAGLGRTFQRPELFDSLTVRECVELGREASLAGGRLHSQLVGRRGDRARVDDAARDAIELAGIGSLLDVRLSALGSAQRRMVELARCLAGPFDVLLLDEPSAGLDRNETDRFADVLRDIVSTRDIAVLLVEHDMSVVMGVCDYIYVLDFGRLVFEGGPETVRESPIVRAAYLGSDELTIEPASNRLV